MREILLSRNKLATVDDEVFEVVNQWKWYYGNGYAAVGIWGFYDWNKGKRVGSIILMHRWILESFYNVRIGGLEVDHINGNGLDNRLENLRVATKQQNLCNQKLHKNNTSGFKGVTWCRAKKKWEAAIDWQRKCIYLGVFPTPEDAARAYNEAALRLHKEFANLNKIS